jgi:hypothetical protein
LADLKAERELFQSKNAIYKHFFGEPEIFVRIERTTTRDAEQCARSVAANCAPKRLRYRAISDSCYLGPKR